MTQETKMINNWEVFYGLVEKKLSKDFSEPLLNLLNDNDEKIITAPASSSDKYVGAFPGGLVWHSINILRTMKDVNKTLSEDNRVSSDEMIVTALFHDIGKIGTLDEDYYIGAKSDWHANNGFPFQINPSMSSYSVPTISLWWLQNYNVNVSLDVLTAINSVGKMNDMFSKELYNVEPLTLLLQNAVRTNCALNKEVTKL